MKHLLLIGAQKAGSTFLYSLLRQHPRILAAVPKEPMFFSKPCNDSTEYDVLYSHYTNHHYDYFLDASASYLHVAGTAERAFKLLNNETRIICIVRDPISRIRSSFKHELKHGRELRQYQSIFPASADTIETLHAAEESLLKASYLDGIIQPHYSPKYRYRDQLFQFRYIYNSCYMMQLSSWASLFPRIMIIHFDYLVTNPTSTLSSLASWLELDEYSFDLNKNSSNSTRLSISKSFAKSILLKRDHKKYINPLQIFSLLRNSYRSLGQPYSINNYLSELAIHELQSQFYQCFQRFQSIGWNPL